MYLGFPVACPDCGDDKVKMSKKNTYRHTLIRQVVAHGIVRDSLPRPCLVDISGKISTDLSVVDLRKL